MGGIGKTLQEIKLGRYRAAVQKDNYGFGRGWIIWRGRYSISLEIWLGPYVVYLIRNRGGA